MYIARPKKDGSVFGNCKPCENCEKYLIKFGIKCVKYTNNIDDIPVLCEMKLKK